MTIGFSPRKQKITIYSVQGYENNPELLAKLGAYKIGKSCLYISKLSDIDLVILEQILREAHDATNGKHCDYKTQTWSS
jgi:hypothetical protein